MDEVKVEFVMWAIEIMDDRLVRAALQNDVGGLGPIMDGVCKPDAMHSMLNSFYLLYFSKKRRNDAFRRLRKSFKKVSAMSCPCYVDGRSLGGDDRD